MLGRHIMALARAATLLAVLGATCAYAADVGYLAPPGVPANEFPLPQRPVAPIVSPGRSVEEHRDSTNRLRSFASHFRSWHKCEVRDVRSLIDMRGKSGRRGYRCYCVRNLYATIRVTMLAKISSAGRDFRIIGLVEWRAADRPG